MAFFSPYDNADLKFYISRDILDKYDKSRFYLLADKKNLDLSINLHNNSILLDDIDSSMLKLIIKCMIFDFNIDIINQYLISVFNMNFSIMNTGIYEKNFEMGIYFGCNVSDTNFSILKDLLQILNKYNLPKIFNFKISEFKTIGINQMTQIYNNEEVKFMKSLECAKNWNLQICLEKIILCLLKNNDNQNKSNITFRYKFLINISENPKFQIFGDPNFYKFIEPFWANGE